MHTPAVDPSSVAGLVAILIGMPATPADPGEPAVA
jgi:hypothetical protein